MFHIAVFKKIVSLVEKDFFVKRNFVKILGTTELQNPSYSLQLTV